MISVDNDLAPQDVRPEILESVDHCQKLFLRSRIIYLSFDEGLTCIENGRRLCQDETARSLISHSLV